jgi:hypothetical protein
MIEFIFWEIAGSFIATVLVGKGSCYSYSWERFVGKSFVWETLIREKYIDPSFACYSFLFSTIFVNI